jgi:hypothetical protein
MIPRPCNHINFWYIRNDAGHTHLAASTCRHLGRRDPWVLCGLADLAYVTYTPTLPLCRSCLKWSHHHEAKAEELMAREDA